MRAEVILPFKGIFAPWFWQRAHFGGVLGELELVAELLDEFTIRFFMFANFLENFRSFF
jgi:hypothetical protein